jgi:hypothetical protein
MITASANTGTANLPVTLAVCQTNPVSRACLAPPGADVHRRDGKGCRGVRDMQDSVIRRGGDEQSLNLPTSPKSQ